MLFVLTGVSGTGKTTLLEAVRSELSESAHVLADIDQDGVPTGADERWRRSQVARWLAEAAARAQQGSSVVLSGTVLPSDIPPPGRTDPAVRFCVLRASSEAVRSRLQMRYAAQEAAAELERVVGQSVGSFIEETIRHQAAFERCFETGVSEFHVVDTSERSIVEARDRVLSWIGSKA